MRKEFAKLRSLPDLERNGITGNQSSLNLLNSVNRSPFPDHSSTRESHSPETYTIPLPAVLNYSLDVRGFCIGQNVPDRTDFNGNNNYKDRCCFFSYPEIETSLRQIEERNYTRRMNK